ncbi:MAG: argininosuccinate lyase [Methanocellales archaeon]
MNDQHEYNIDILRRGRFKADAPEIVKQFTASIKADEWIFQADIMVDKAHVIMLRKCGIITELECAKILEALSKIERLGVDALDLSKYDDVHIAIESNLIKEIGEEIGGKMHVARSRNDEVAACIRIALREEMLRLMLGLLNLREVLLKKAEQHIYTLMPGFTHLQHAQPTTLAHHLLAHVDAIKRDFDRIVQAYSRVNLNPLGSAALASTGFDIDRELTSKLLGFDGLIENSMDAVSTRDFAIEVLGAIANLMVNLSRICEELIIWSTLEFGYIELSEEYASTSSIMPQKKNPDVLELVRAKTGTVAGCLLAAIAICKALPMSYNRDLQEVTPHLLTALNIAQASLKICSGAIETMKVNIERMQDMTALGFITATELADTIVRACKIPFRTAHQIVGIVAREKGEITLEKLNEAAVKVIGRELSTIGLTEELLKRALDVKQNVEIRKTIGGPSPKEVMRMISIRKNLLSLDDNLARDKIKRIERARLELERAIGEAYEC